MSVVGVIVALVALILASPIPIQADERGWQGWAFEMRDDDLRGWVGAWTLGGCEALRRDAIEEQLDATIGACYPVTLTDEPSGVEVWGVISDSRFVAASTRDICEDASPGFSIRPVALISPACQRLWIRVGV